MLVVMLGVRQANEPARSAAARVQLLPYFLVFIADVVRELGFLEAGGGHALVTPGARRRRVGRIQTRLDQRLARLARDHRLQLPRRERVHVACLRSHEEHHLRSRQR